MNRKLKRIWRSATALCMAFVMMFSTCGTVFANDAMEEEVIHYVSLGASNTNGYGLDGYLPEDVHEDPLAASKANLNVYGYKREPEAAYPAQVAKELETWTGKEVKLHQLAISSMRVEEVRYLLDDTMEPDDYMIWRFTGGQKWFKIAEEGGVEALREAYRKSLTDADYVTLDLGWNNFGVFAFNYIKSILGGGIWPSNDGTSKTGVPDVSDYIDENGEAEYQKIKAMALEKLSANMDGADSSMKEKLDKVADVLACATMGACYNYDIVMEKIYELNPDTTVVVINIQNLADDLVVNFEGTELLLGDLYGELIDFVNLYRASESPYADKCVFADAGDVTTFLDDLVAWDGDPTTLSGDMEDCFDMYDDSLYVRSIVEYMMVGQALSGLFSGFKDVFKTDTTNQYNYEFELTGDLNELLALDLSKLDFKNPGGADEDVEKYGAAVARHLKNLRAKNFDEYDYVFENLLTGNQQQDAAIEAVQTGFKAKLQGVYKTYINTLDYAYDVVATIFQEAAKINNLTVDADRMADFNDVADKLMTAIANNFIGSAQNKFEYELWKNGLQNETDVTEDPDVMVDDVLKLMKEEPAVAAIAVLAVRYELGNSFFAHPTPAGHDEITDAIMDALKDGSHAGDFTDTKVSQYIEVLKNRYPNLYALVVGAEQVGEMDDLAIIISMLKASDNSALTGVDLDALEAGIRAAQRDYAESKTPEQQARAEEVAYDLMNRLYDLAAIATGSDYKVTEDSWYVSLGDSTISGYGLEGYEDGMLNGAGQYVTGSAHVLLAKHLYGDAWRSYFNNLCRGALRADDLLLFLGGDVEKDDYYYQEIEPNLLEGSLAATQEEFISNVKKADLISVAIGGGNVFTFVGKQMNRVMGNDTREPLKLDWSRIGVDENDATMKELNELLDLLVPIIDEMGLMDQYVPEDMELENPAKFSRALVETLLYGYASYNYYYSQVLTKIKEINPDAQLLVLGMFNPVDDWTMSTTINGQKTFVNIGGGIGNVIDSANLQNLAFALQNSNTTFVDVSDAETIMEAENPGVTLTFKHYYDGSLKSNGKSVHASVAGHKYIFNQMADTLSVKRQIQIILNELYDLLETYGPEVAAQVWAQWEEYGYVDAVNETIDKLTEVLEARYEVYTTETLPAVNASVAALTEQKDALTAQLVSLNEQLAAKKAELEKVLSEQEIGSVTVPDININVDLGNNEQTDIPEHECVVSVDGNAIVAELEAAIKDIEHAIATVEALVANVEADIDDMVALAVQIADAVASLETTIKDIAKAANDVKEAVAAVVEVLTNESANSIVSTVVGTYETVRAAALEAANLLDIAMVAAEETMADIDEMVEILSDDAEALYNKFMTDLPGCIEQIPEEGMMVLGAAVLGLQKAYEEGEKLINEKLAEELLALEAEYADDIAKAEADLEAIKAEIQAEIDAKYAEAVAETQAKIDAAKAEAEELLAALEAELKGYQDELAALGEDVAEEVRQTIQAKIDRVTADIATVNEDLACAVEHLETALQLTYEEIVAEVKALYAEAVAQLEKVYNDIMAELEAAKKELEEAAGKSLEELKEAIDKQIEEFNKIIDEISKELDSVLDSIRENINAVQDAVEGILSGSLEAVEELKDALEAMGAEALAELVDIIVEQINAMLLEATTADMVVDNDFKFVAIGDESAKAEGYVERLAAAINAEAAENGVSDIEVVNYAKTGNTVAAERANLSDVTDADLVTIGFSNVTFLNNALDTAMSGANTDFDWAGLLGEEALPYVEDVLADIKAEIAALELEEEYTVILETIVEAMAYNAVEYAVELPGLISDIKAVNSDALIIIVGMYNPLADTTINVGGAEFNVSEYVDYLVDAVAVHGTAYAIISGDAIYVDARDVDVANTDKELSALDLATLVYNKCAALYPSTVGDDYIAGEIADALDITYVRTERLLGDVNLDGKVTAADVNLLYRYVGGLAEFSELQKQIGDVNQDGVVTGADVNLLYRYVGGLAPLN